LAPKLIFTTVIQITQKNSDNYMMLETEQNNEIIFTRNPGTKIEGRQIRQTD